jgi:DNA-binding CsgD family transcriptional regulator
MDERGSIVCGPECSITNCALRGGKIHSFNLLSQRQDGREIWLNLSTMFVADFDSHPDVVVHMFRDIDQLQRAQGLLGEFLSRASELVEPAPSPKRVREEGEDKLTKRERQVLTLLAQGLTAKEIAHHLTISEATARNHIQNILSKLDLHSRLEAALYAIEHGVA